MVSPCESALFFYRSPLQGMVAAVAFGWVMIRRDFRARDNPSTLEAYRARTERRLAINLKCANFHRALIRGISSKRLAFQNFRFR
jgi:hypothetical protein